MRRYELQLTVDTTLPVQFSVLARDEEHAESLVTHAMVAAAASCETSDIVAWDITHIQPISTKRD